MDKLGQSTLMKYGLNIMKKKEYTLVMHHITTGCRFAASGVYLGQ